MKQKLLLWMFFLIVGSGTWKVQAQSLVIQMKDGTQCVRNLNTLQKFSFSDNNLMLKLLDGATESYNVLIIRNLYFSQSSVVTPTTIDSYTTGNNKLSVYPNPTDQLIYIRDLAEGTFMVNICKLDGIVVLSSQVTSGRPSIDVSFLKSGFYLLKVNNQVLKFIKL